MTTVWKARRVGDRILCGRRVPPDGPPSCMGVVATIEVGLRLHVRTAPDDEFRGRRYVLDEASAAVLERRRGNRLVNAAMPLVVPCSHGGHPNELTYELLGLL